MTATRIRIFFDTRLGEVPLTAVRSNHPSTRRNSGSIAVFLSAAAVPAAAQHTAPQASPLRASIDRAASTSAGTSKLPQRRATPVHKAALQGGGGGGGMMAMTLIGTIAGLAATYFVVKEMKKQTDQTTTTAQ